MIADLRSPERIIKLALGGCLVLAPLVTGWSAFESGNLAGVSVAAGLFIIATALFRICPDDGACALPISRKDDK